MGINGNGMDAIEKRVLGRTGLEVTLLGLGAGGNSRLGLSLGLGEDHAADVVRAALDMGLTMVDTAHGYRTERAVGQVVRGRRERVVLASKHGYLDENHELLTADAFETGLHASLRELDVEMIDIYFIHGLRLPYYEASLERFGPVLERARQAGKIRFIGVTEAFETDTKHEMLERALQDDLWDVMMVGYNLINSSARKRIFPHTQRKGIATLGMFAVRRGLIDETHLRTLLGRIAETGALPAELAAEPDLMSYLGLRGVCESLSEAAYRFCAFTAGMDCVLSGTSNAAHLADNLRSVQRGPLPQAALERLDALFGHVDGFSAQLR